MPNKVKIITQLSFIALALLSFCQLSVQAQHVESNDLGAKVSTIRVYSSQAKDVLGTISSNQPYNLISRTSQWSLVKFPKEMIGVWVSADFGREVDGQKWLITGNRINLRPKPSISTIVIGVVNKGYEAILLERRDGFVKIHAPKTTIFAIKNVDLNSLNRSDTNSTTPSRWSLSDNKSQIEIKDTDPALASKKKISQKDLKKKLVAEQDSQSQKKRVNTLSASTLEKKYLLSPGDIISLLVFGENDLSLSGIRIPQSGRVSFPLIGGVDVVNLTIDQLESTLVNKFSQGYVKNPKLTITIDSYRPIFVKGAVDSTGSFTFAEGLTVAKAIALAGGAKTSAKENGVSITRNGEVIADSLTLDSKLAIESGDIISVENDIGVALDEPAFYVYLHGEVKRPGEYTFRRGLTIEKAIVLAGGFTLRASRKRISVSRIVEGRQEPKKLKKVPLYMPVEPGDIIDVGASWF